MDTITEKELVARIQEFVDKSGSQVDAAKALGVSPAYLSDILNGNREPGPKVLQYWHLEAETIYRKKKAS